MDNNNSRAMELVVVNRERVKLHRARRKSAGLQELKLWVRASDARKVLTLLQPFLKAADNLLHEFQGGQWPKRKFKGHEKKVLKD